MTKRAFTGCISALLLVLIPPNKFEWKVNEVEINIWWCDFTSLRVRRGSTTIVNEITQSMMIFLSTRSYVSWSQQRIETNRVHFQIQNPVLPIDVKPLWSRRGPVTIDGWLASRNRIYAGYNNSETHAFLHNLRNIKELERFKRRRLSAWLKQLLQITIFYTYIFLLLELDRYIAREWWRLKKRNLLRLFKLLLLFVISSCIVVASSPLTL